MDNQTWARFIETEEMFWNRVQAMKGLTRYHIIEFSRFVQHPEHGNIVNPVSINLDGMPRFQAIATIAYVLNQKLKLREVNGRYQLTWNRTATRSDPYPIQFTWKGIKHRMSSNYNGNSDQVGNYKVETFRGGVWIGIIFNNIDTLDTPEMDFMFMCEIARRKTRDPQRQNGDDIFRGNLPIAMCVAIGLYLNEAKIITVESFLGTGMQNNVFKDAARVRRARNLLTTALHHYKFGDICVAVSDYYQFDSVVADVAKLLF